MDANGRRAGYALLLASAAGTVLAPSAPLRWGRPGGALLVCGLAALLARDTTMIASGAVGHLQVAPRVLLVGWTISSAGAICLGAWPWLTSAPPKKPRQAVRIAGVLATGTFAIHTARQAIFLSPGHGLR